MYAHITLDTIAYAIARIIPLVLRENILCALYQVATVSDVT